MRIVAALFIDRLGVYPTLPGVECWDEARDACLYNGPHPVVAHPPCGPWSRLRHLSQEDERTKELGRYAIRAAKRWSGVVEQPAFSRLFADFGIARSELVEVTQVSWGHVARKPTWLYFVDVPEIVGIRTGGSVTHWASGMRPHARKGRGGFAPEGIKICSAEQRRRTPIAFAEWLVGLARTAKPRFEVTS